MKTNPESNSKFEVGSSANSLIGPGHLKAFFPPFRGDHVTLEKFGGKGYYKLIESGLKYSGTFVESSFPIFSSEDVGKSFCGLFAHKNPLQPDYDNYYPGIEGSRYAIITNYINPQKIQLNFSYNGQSDKGYVFFDNSMAFRAAVNAAKISVSKTLELEDGKTYVVPEYQAIGLSQDFFLMAKKGANLKIGIEDYFQWSEKKMRRQDDALFNVGENSLTLGIKNVNFIPPHRRLSGAQLFFTSLFKSSPKKDQSLKIIVLNMDSTLEVNGKDPRYNQFGFGYGFLYSSGFGNYVIGKNIRHRGPGFMDFKANHGGGLFAVFENIETDFQNEEKFASPQIKVKGKLENNVFKITSENTIYQIYSYDFGEGNVAHILHFGRYTFMIDGQNSVINAAEFKVRPFAGGKTLLKVRDNLNVYAKKVELHAGDELIHLGISYRVIEKNRTYVTEWDQGDEDTKYAMCLKLDKPMPVSSGMVEFDVFSVGESLNNGREIEAYLIYKANYDFRTYQNTKFGNEEILSSTPVGHLSYNHKEITLWAKNFKHRGFYRQSQSDVGHTNGYTMINCEGFEDQFKPDVTIKNTGEMPEVAKALLSDLEAKV